VPEALKIQLPEESWKHNYLKKVSIENTITWSIENTITWSIENTIAWRKLKTQLPEVLKTQLPEESWKHNYLKYFAALPI